MITSTTDDELRGDSTEGTKESFSMCKHMDDFAKSDYKHVTHNCKYCDAYGRCTRDTCYYDKEESPDICGKFWYNCIFCSKQMSLDPKQVTVPICDECLSLIQQCLKTPWTCAKCGASQSKPSKILFSRLCDECVDNLLFNDTCKHWELNSPADVADFDLP